MRDADIEKCLSLIDDPSVKEALKQTTEEAIEHGVRSQIGKPDWSSVS